MQSEEKRTIIQNDSSLEPSTRVKQLAQYGAMVDVDPNVPPRRYFCTIPNHYYLHCFYILKLS